MDDLTLGLIYAVKHSENLQKNLSLIFFLNIQERRKSIILMVNL